MSFRVSSENLSDRSIRKFMKSFVQFLKNEKIYLLSIVAVLSIIIPFSSSVAWYLPVVLIVLLIGILFFFVLLKDVSIGVLLVTFLLPFEQIGGIEIAGMNVRLSQLVFLATFGAWLLKGLHDKSLKIKVDFKLALLFIFAIVSIASFSYTINLFRSVQIFLFILFSFTVYFFFSSYKFDQKFFKKIVLVLFASMTITCLFGLFQFAGDMVGLPQSITRLEDNYVKAVFGFPRIQSTANEPLNFANYLLLPIGIAFAIFAEKFIKKESGNWWDLKYSSLPILILSGIVLILTFSRGGWGGAALAILLLGLKYVRHLFTFKNIVLGIVILITSISGIFGIAEITNAPFTLKSVLSRINVKDFSAQHRVMTLQDGLDGWKKNPWLGIGLGAYGPYVAKYQNVKPEGGWQTVNNEYAELLIETGIIGLSVVCIFWSSFFLESLRKSKKLAPFDNAIYLGMVAALAGMLLQYISFSTLYVFHLWYLLGILNNEYWHRK